MEVKTTFSRRLKQFDGLTWLTLTPTFYDRSTPLLRSPVLTSSYATVSPFQLESLQSYSVRNGDLAA